VAKNYPHFYTLWGIAFARIFDYTKERHERNKLMSENIGLFSVDVRVTHVYAKGMKL